MHYLCFFFFNDTATTEIYTLSLHDALPISLGRSADAPRPWLGITTREADEGLVVQRVTPEGPAEAAGLRSNDRDRKSTRLNSSHANISYAVFCLKKKKHHSIRT